MSNSDEAVEKATLIVEGDPGVEIRVLDGDFTLRARGTVELEASLSPALYMINWKVADAIQQEIVRLRPGQVRRVSQKEPGLLGKGAKDDAIRSAARSLGPLPQKNSARADIMILIEGAKGLSFSSETISLFHRDKIGDPVRSDGKAVREASEGTHGEFAARVYHVRPDTYRLQYQSLQGEKLDQIVPAFAGRRTVITLRSGYAQMLVKNGGKLSPMKYDGVEPVSTTIFSVPQDQPPGTASDLARLTSILLRDLGARRTALGRTLLGDIISKQTDPLARIYAAAMIVQRIEGGLLPALDLEVPKTTAQQKQIDREWLGYALDLLNLKRGKGVPADVPVMKWRIRELLGDRNQQKPEIATPPMLDCAWKWALMQSVSNPNNFPKSYSFRAAERGAIGYAPWLAWRNAAAKGGEIAEAPKTRGTLQSTMVKLAQEAKGLIDRHIDSSQAAANEKTGFFVDPFANFTPEARALTQAAIRTFSRSAASSNKTRELAKRFVAAAQLPASTLQSLAFQALEEVVQSFSSTDALSASSSSAEPLTKAPALSRLVTHLDDPQKDRFGGLAEAQGFRLSATFGKVREDWVDVTLAVVADTVVGDAAVEFYLHDTFKPNCFIERFKEGRSELQVRAWGGFTCGVWIPSKKIELELDLAKIPSAPRLIQEL